jgi:hypothetical protein
MPYHRDMEPVLVDETPFVKRKKHRPVVIFRQHAKRHARIRRVGWWSSKKHRKAKEEMEHAGQGQDVQGAL